MSLSVEPGQNHTQKQELATSNTEIKVRIHYWTQT